MPRFLPVFTLSCFLLCSGFSASAKEISIPISLEYDLLEAIILRAYFNDPGDTAQLVNEGNGCIELTLSNPRFSGRDEVLNMSTEIFVHVGTPIGEYCLMSYQWEGSMAVSQLPKLDNQNWELSFETVDTTMFASNGEEIDHLNLVFDRLIPIANEYMRGFSINLDTPVEDLRTFILPMFTTEARKEADQLLNSIRPGNIKAEEDRLVVAIKADAIQLKDSTEEAQPEVLTEAEMENFLELWETWDSLLVYLISVLSEQPLSESERLQLVDLILETRYEFVAQINDGSAQTDFVRDQFLKGWQLLSSIFKRHLLHSPTETRLGYLSFLTAVDALMILDELGPTFGIEISRNGLIRLAKILGGEAVELHYSPDVNKALQQLFQAYPESDRHRSGDDPTPPADPDSALNSMLLMLDSLIAPSAHAGPLPTFAEIKRWQPPKRYDQEYLNRIRKLLKFALTSLTIRRELSTGIDTLYQQMIPAIAWQESCFRQFVVKDAKLTYLLSYNYSSVGIMQVNERVWRGVYDIQRLRWDIRYNASAGCEIVDLYLQKYALKKYGPEILAKTDLLAQLLYAMYNGGPGQYGKFLKRRKSANLYDSDLLFAQKYDWVKNEAWEQTEKCF